MILHLRLPFYCIAFLGFGMQATAQLTITPSSNAQALAQRLVGDGVSISNVTFTGSTEMAAFFNSRPNVGLGLDSGIVITNGRAKTSGGDNGVDLNGLDIADNVLADNSWNLGGDTQLANAIGFPLSELHDAAILEFDFIPLGDSIKFRYVFSSEEYTPAFACPGTFSSYNDAFAFFITGPGFPAPTNIALVPNTNLPVSIFNINNVKDFSGVALCPANTIYYVDNTSGSYLTHDGHTTVLTALAEVVPCQTYHLKLVISDVGDALYDSGVFLEAKSLSSNSFELTNLTQTDANGVSYLVEGCVTGSLKIKRRNASSFSQVVNLAYGGTVTNGVDVQTMPNSVTIPSGQSEVLLNIHPLIDNITEGNEILKIYTLAACGSSSIPTDSAMIELRDYDTLTVFPGQHPDTAFVCHNSSITLHASVGFTTYQWDANSTLNNANIRTPIATPQNEYTKYYCTASIGTCNARDSINIKVKKIQLDTKTDVNCAGGNTGQITTSVGTGWQAPVEYSLNNQAWQPAATFNNLPVGNYTIKIRDASGCIDSVSTSLVQSYPDLLIQQIDTSFASCSGNADGHIIVNATGGKPNIQYSINNGSSYQNSNNFPVRQGNYIVKIKDANGCLSQPQNVVIGLHNNIILQAGLLPPFCEGSSSGPLPLISDASSFAWTPTAHLSNAGIKNPIANPTADTKYYVTATRGICNKKDSIQVRVNPAPLPNAGDDVAICVGGSIELHGSGGIEFTWTPSDWLSDPHAATPTVVRPLENRYYYLKVKDANGCNSLVYDTVMLKVTPSVRMFAGYDTVAAMGQPIQLYAVELGSSGVRTYSWDPPYGLNNPFIQSPIATIDHDMIYEVTGRTAENCEGSARIHIKVYKGPEIYVPSAFTPNNDGTNDILRAIPVGMKQTQFFKVYNRWGQLVFSTRNFHQGWNGRINGVMQSTGTYVWIAQGIDYRGKTVYRKGTTTLLQ